MPDGPCGLVGKVLTRLMTENREAAQDDEGMQQMRTLARNMTFLMRSIALGKEKYGLPQSPEERVYTNFIR